MIFFSQFLGINGEEVWRNCSKEEASHLKGFIKIYLYNYLGLKINQNLGEN